MIAQFLALLATHWIADFVLQTHWQASNKSKRGDALALHVLTYSAVLLVGSIAIFGTDLAGKAIAFTALNGALHFITDYFTSRASSRFYAKQDWHNFFVVIGFDQLIHQITLAGTMMLFFGGSV